MNEEIKRRATQAEQEKQSLQSKLEKLEASIQAIKQDNSAKETQNQQLEEQAKAADERTRLFEEALNNITATVSAAINEPDKDPMKLLEAALKDLETSEAKVAQLTTEKETVLEQVEALEARLRVADKVSAELAETRERVKGLSDGIGAIASKLGADGGLLALFSAPSAEEKVEAIIQKLELRSQQPPTR